MLILHIAVTIASTKCQHKHAKNVFQYTIGNISRSDCALVDAKHQCAILAASADSGSHDAA